jgi:sterol desaturase/sphingolipid hydroxylase (fatty acid hydroxylase superfamily)
MTTADQVLRNVNSIENVSEPGSPIHRHWMSEIVSTLAMGTVLYGVARGIDWAVYRSGAEFTLGRGFSKVLLYSILPLPIVSLFGRFVPSVGPTKSLTTWFLNIRIAIFDQFATALAAAIAAICVVMFCHLIHFGPGLIDLRFAGVASIPGIAGAFLLSSLIGDLFFYLYHRVMHTWFFWQVHKLHHMDEELDVLTSKRDSLLDAFIATALMQVPMTILFRLHHFGALRAGVVLALYSTLHNCFIHSNTRIGFGKLSFLYVSPQFHRIHHSRLEKHYDKNLTASFPIWDILFGTYYEPAKDEYPLTGVEGESTIHSVLQFQLVPLREWRKMYLEWRAKKIKLDGSIH